MPASVTSDTSHASIENLQTGKAKWSLPDSSLKAITLSADGKILAGFVQEVEWKQTDKGARGTTKASHLSLWDLATGELRQTIAADTFRPRAIAFLPDGKTLAGLDGSGIALRWFCESMLCTNVCESAK